MTDILRILRISSIFRIVTHPVFVFVSLQVVWLAIVILWVIWFLNQKSDLTRLAETLGTANIHPSYGIAFLTVGCILLGIILVGMVLLFVYYQKQRSLNSQQRIFLSSVTHELRSPLASLQLSFETLQKGVPAEVLAKLYGMVGHDLDRLVRLVDRILISARLDRGIIGLDQGTEDIPLRNAIESAVQEIQYLDPNLRNRVDIVCPDDIHLNTTKLGVSVVIGNLIENAVKYSDPGSPIKIRGWKVEDQIFFSVADKGIGLSKKERNNIFKMFQRSDITTHRAIPGTGLGLYIVRSTLKMLGGRVWAESPGPGLGSTFYVVFPQSELQLVK